MESAFTLFQVCDSFIKHQLGIPVLKPLMWECPGEALIGQIPEDWCRDPIWVRYFFSQEPTSSGLIRRATIQFTREAQRREDRHNCSLFCSIEGIEYIVGNSQKFEFEVLPLGKHESIKIGPKANFFLIGKILTLFHYAYGNFHLEDKLK